MAVTVTDDTLIKEILKTSKNLIKEYKVDEASPDKIIFPEDYPFPLDNEIVGLLKKIRPTDKNNPYISYEKSEETDILWIKLIEKSIQCLRYFDEREPFEKNSNKRPYSYGIDNLKEYHKKYSDFEKILYGGADYYRDHVFHAIRTWMLGVLCLFNSGLSNDSFLLVDKMELDGEKNNSLFESINSLEKLSMWTIISLCHDLGYPLEKSQQILEKTNLMMKEFISNPGIWNNYSFSGGQAKINDYIVKFMSTKMIKNNNPSEEPSSEEPPTEENSYIGRIQPKYYIKFLKSLESFKHGIVSSVVIYTMLLYFLESDFNLNDDYNFDNEGARQFYIRREILRAISAHTCPDVYSIKVSTFTSLLFICDELQEWGRKSWNQLYVGECIDNVTLEIRKYNPKKIDIVENVDLKSYTEEEAYSYIARLFKNQYQTYIFVFRDGQDSNNREFDFTKKMLIKMPSDGADKNEVEIFMKIMSNEKDVFQINLNEVTTIEMSTEIHKRMEGMKSDLIEIISKK